jgi:hypothetical protein
MERIGRRAVAAAIGVWFAIGSPPAFAESADTPVVTVRIRDYVHLSPDLISKAQRLVTKLFATADVRAVWAQTIRPDEFIDVPDEIPRALSVNILTSEMSSRLMVTDGTLGLAAPTLDEGGVVAYALFDRIWRVARTSAADPADVLGLVIAHELAHLLMPYGSHSPIGLMRPTWDLRDFRNTDRRRFAFTRGQVDDMRRLLGHRTSPAPIGSQAR